MKNPLLAPWTGPYAGVPPFDQVKVEQFQPALEAAMAETLANVDKIANDPAPPTFDNTLAALEKASRTLDRAGSIYGVFSSAMSTPEFQAVEREMAPKLAAFQDKITQNEKLFARIAAVYDARETSCKTPEQKRLAWYQYTSFVRAGAKLDAAALPGLLREDSVPSHDYLSIAVEFENGLDLTYYWSTALPVGTHLRNAFTYDENGIKA